MTLTPSGNRRRILAGAALVAAPAALLAADVAVHIAGREEPLLRAAVAFLVALMLPAILGLVHLLRERADWAGLAGGALCLVGTYGAVRMSSLFQLDALLQAGVDGVPAEAVRTALAADPLLFVSVFPPGVCFPLGLLVLSTGLFVSGAASRPVAAALALGAVLFPVGRIGAVVPAILAGDVLMLIAMASIGRRVLSRPGAWETEAHLRGHGGREKIDPSSVSSCENGGMGDATRWRRRAVPGASATGSPQSVSNWPCSRR